MHIYGNIDIKIDKEYFREKFDKVLTSFPQPPSWEVYRYILLDELMKCFDEEK